MSSQPSRQPSSLTPAERRDGDGPRGPTQRYFGSLVDRGGHLGPEERYATVDARGPFWGLGPKGYVRSDARTRQEICETIACQGWIDASGVDVKVEQATCILTGSVEREDHKRALELLVARVRGVGSVRNQLCLGRPPSR
jgi:hypothetical protein